MALNYGPGWGCYMADTNKTPPRERKRVPPRIMTTANTNTSHTALEAKWRWNIYIEAVPSHRCRKKAELEISFAPLAPYSSWKELHKKNSSYCWLGSGTKSAALCCGLVSSGLCWWMRRAANESYTAVHTVMGSCQHAAIEIYVLASILCVVLEQVHDWIMSKWQTKFKVW